MSKISAGRQRPASLDHVYLVTHAFGKWADERLKIIGIFHTRKKAREIVKELKTKPGFDDRRGKFVVSRETLGAVGWSEGFADGAEAVEYLVSLGLYDDVPGVKSSK